MILYKYCDEKGIDLLKNARIKISNLSEINDPFEFLPQMEDDFEELNELLYDLYEYQKKNYRILSLSQCAGNIIMWGHYCNKHKGILFKIDTDNTCLGDEGENVLGEVTYSAIRPQIVRGSLLKALKNGDEVELRENIKLLTYAKYEGWEYEEEVRAILKYDHEESYDYFNIPADSILEVVLGVNATWETEALVKALLQEPRFNHIMLKKAEIDKKNYSLNYKAL